MMDEFIDFSKRNGFSIPDVTPFCQGNLMTSVVKWLLILLNASSLRINFFIFKTHFLMPLVLYVYANRCWIVDYFIFSVVFEIANIKRV